ncbi:nitronate monooxygenase [Sinomonas sp. JGH33]|uniref:Nitronate monooxygenase n=1 Tax=Sinomonas terricola TaxID=3110330 RepID=A0ABU5T3F3_9MICC|nr:nitronate monooxygenase [Sinomonas sp. JGH33]MEA5454100.1 nitronate monooxygenase [Sinomonas sp. JGH33]
MLRTPVCGLLGIEHPILQAGMGPFGSGAALAAAVSNAGALGTLGGSLRPHDDLRAQVRLLKESTDRPFVVNFTQPWLQQHSDSIDVVLELGVPIVSLALGDPGAIPRRAHDAGALFIQQVHTVEQALLAAERGVDVVIAQGTEAGGFGGTIGMAALVPQVVDAVDPLPVLAAGGIADGRGLAAAVVLGAQGANIGTRFLASVEASISEAWKRAIIAAGSAAAVKAPVWDQIFPKPGNGAFDVVPRALETEFIRRWEADSAGAAARAEELKQEMADGIQQGRMEEFVPFGGQSAGLIREILPAAEIVSRLVAEASRALALARHFAEA